jgi:hypothetical protein
MKNQQNGDEMLNSISKMNKELFMKKSKIWGLAALLLAVGLALSSCVEFMDGFVDGYQYGRNLGYDPSYNLEITEF